MEDHNLINYQLQERCQPKMAIHLLENVAEDKCLTNPPYKPGHGDWYVFSYVHTPENKQSWHNDGHQWRNYGLRKEFYQDRLLYKRYFRQVISNNKIQSSLSRLVYELVAPLTLPRFLVQYFDEQQAPSKVSDAAARKKPPIRKKLPATKHGVRRDANRRQLLAELKDSEASRLLLSRMSCCTTPASRPTNGYWYIYKYDGAEGRSSNWQDDGLLWRQQHSSVVTVGGATMLKRRYIRLVNGTAVDFHRHCYQFVCPAAASLASLNKDGSGASTDASNLPSTQQDENTLPVHGSFNNNNMSSHDPFGGLFQYDDGDKSPQKQQGQKPLSAVTKKRRNSRRWSPVKRGKKRKGAVKPKEKVASGDEEKTDVLLQRVLIHYLGTDDATVMDQCIKKINRSSPLARQQVALCRAVPLTCSNSTLQTSNIGPNRGIHRRLNAREAARLLLGTPSHKSLPCLPLPLPKAGLWCVLDSSPSRSSVASQPKDGFSWRPVGKTKHSVGEHTLLLRRYRRTVRGNSVLLYRHVYSLPDSDPSHVLVHYTGLDDELNPHETTGGASSPCKEEEESEGLLEQECDGKEDVGEKGWTTVKDEEMRQEAEDVTTVLNKNGLSVMAITKLTMPLEMEAVVHLLEDTPEEDCLTFAPSYPRNGHWYVFSYAGLPTFCHKTWRKDCIRWRHNGTHSRKIHGKILNIRYYKRVVSGRGSSFLRYAYEILDDDGNNVLKRMLVHYLGADDRDEALPGISRRIKDSLGLDDSVVVKVGDLANDKFYTVECKSFVPDLSAETGLLNEGSTEEDPVLRQAVASILEPENQIFQGDNCHLTSDTSELVSTVDSRGSRSTLQTGFDCSNNFYYEEVVTTSDPSLLPTKVVEDVSSRYECDDRNTSVDSGMPIAYRMSRSTMESLHEFIHRIANSHSMFYQLLPSTIVVMVSKYNVNEFKSIAADDCCHVLFYDRTWNVRDFHVSCLYAKHSFCESETAFPLAFSIHELDDSSTHTAILEQILRSCPSLNSKDVILLTDSSPGVIAACSKVCPKTLLVSSWTNVAEAVKLWCAKNDFTSELLTLTVVSVEKLLRTFSISEYNACYQEVSYYWSPEFKAFYEESLSRIVLGSHAESLKRHGMYSEFGLTIGGLLDLIEQIGNLLNDSDVTSIDVLSTLVYYVLYHYQNEIEKGKLKVVGTAFNRKPDYMSRFGNRKSFFPSHCALTEDVTAVILYKMKIRQLAVAKNEPEHTEESEDFGELVNIEFDLDDELRAAAATGHEGGGLVGEFFHQITIDEGDVSSVVLEETVTSITDGDMDSPVSPSGTSEEDAPVVGRRRRRRRHVDNMTSGLRVAPDNLLFEQITDVKSKHRTQQRVQKKNRVWDKPNIFVGKRSTQTKVSARQEDRKPAPGFKCKLRPVARGSYYNMRRMVVNAGHALWEEGGVSHEPVSDTYIVRGGSSSSKARLNAVRLISTGRQECSCSDTERRCEHVVAAMLERLCQEEDEDDQQQQQHVRNESPSESLTAILEGQAIEGDIEYDVVLQDL